MESTFDNCIFYNAILNNSDPYDDHQVMYLVQLQGADLTSVGAVSYTHLTLPTILLV